MVHGPGHVGREVQAAGAHVALDELRQAFLVDRHAARLQDFDLALIDVEADDFIADLRQATARDEAYVAGTED